MNSTNTTNASTRRDSLGEVDLGSPAECRANQEPEDRPFEDWSSSPGQGTGAPATSDAATSANLLSATQSTPTVNTEKDPYLDNHSV
jgi:hypothetical protein